MGSTTKRFAFFLGLTAAAALTTFAFTKQGKRIRKQISDKAGELGRELSATVRDKIAQYKSSRGESG